MAEAIPAKWVGKGETAEDPRLIEGIQDWESLFQYPVPGPHPDYGWTVYGVGDRTGYYYRITADLDFNGSDVLPLGMFDDGTGNHYLQIYLDGGGYTISNARFIDPEQIFLSGVFPLLGNEAIISNLNISNITVVSNPNNSYYSGIFSSELYSARLTNCSVSNSVFDNSIVGEPGTYFGGIAGQISGDTTISSCSVDNISATQYSNIYYYAGGMFGGVYGYDSGVPPITINDCSAENIDIIASNPYADPTGVAGLIGGGSAFTCNNCTVDTINIDSNTEFTSSNDSFGGFIGRSNGYTIFNNCSSSNVTIADDSFNARSGGFIGRTTLNSYPSMSIFTNCSTSNVAIIANEAGGFVGEIDSTDSGEFTGCAVNIANITASYYAGGFAGCAGNGGYFTDCSSNNISATGTRAGGFVGNLYINNYNMYRCSAENAIIMAFDPTSSDEKELGGFVGKKYGTSSMSNCIITNATVGQLTDNMTYAGGFVGRIETNGYLQITSCSVYDSDIIGYNTAAGFCGDIISNQSGNTITASLAVRCSVYSIDGGPAAFAFGVSYTGNYAYIYNCFAAVSELNNNGISFSGGYIEQNYCYYDGTLANDGSPLTTALCKVINADSDIRQLGQTETPGEGLWYFRSGFYPQLFRFPALIGPRMYYEDGRSNIETTYFRYKLMQSDGTLIKDWTTGDIWEEEPAGTYYYTDALLTPGTFYAVEPEEGAIGAVGQIAPQITALDIRNAIGLVNPNLDTQLEQLSTGIEDLGDENGNAKVGLFTEDALAQITGAVPPLSPQDVNAAVWGNEDGLRSLSDNQYDIIADRVDIELGNLVSTGYVIVGQGLGSTHYTNNVDFGPSRQKSGYIVKAYELINNIVDFSDIHAMDTTDINGTFDLWLNPGSYILRIEKNGAAVDTVEIEVV